MKTEWKVGELAKLTGLTVRTLRFYDQIDRLGGYLEEHSAEPTQGRTK